MSTMASAPKQSKILKSGIYRKSDKSGLEIEVDVNKEIVVFDYREMSWIESSVDSFYNHLAVVGYCSLLFEFRRPRDFGGEGFAFLQRSLNMIEVILEKALEWCTSIIERLSRNCSREG